MKHEWIEFKFVDPKTRVFFYHLQLVVDEELMWRLERADMLDVPLFHKESGGLAFGIIGDAVDVAVWSVVNELVKSKLTLTIRTLLDGWKERSSNFASVAAAERVGAQTKIALQNTLAHMATYPELDISGLQRPTLQPDNSISHGMNEIIPLTVEKKAGSLFAKESFYDYRGIRYPQSETPKLLDLLWTETLARVAKAGRGAP